MGAFERALGPILARVSSSMESFAVAYSGGLDSSALLHLAQRYAAKHRIQLFAFHVHHGLSPNADSWHAHCERECARLGVRFDARRIELIDRSAGGVEQAARIGRYAALGELCRTHHVPLLLTAHHQDDQAETVLLQLLRGSGVAGLSGMDDVNTAPGLLGDPDLLIGRPLLGIERSALEGFVSQYQIPYVEDESNSDFRYTRNAVRHKIMPSFAEYFPGFRQRVARTAQHARSAQRLLDELAMQDLLACLEGECINVVCLKRLNENRIDNVLRYWLASRGMRMPSTAWLDEMRTQLLDARDDAQVRVIHADCEIRRHRNRIFLTSRFNDSELDLEPLSFRWEGQARISFPAYRGSLHFDEGQHGVDTAWLRAQELVIRFRSGGEKLKLAPDRPTRSLKHHYQALNIPAWERPRLPIVTTANALLFAAGVGMNYRGVPFGADHSISLRWEFD